MTARDKMRAPTSVPRETPIDEEPTLAALAAEAETNDPPGTSMRYQNATPEERQRALARAAEERAERKASHDRQRDAMLPADWAEYLRTAPPEVQAIYSDTPGPKPGAAGVGPGGRASRSRIVRLGDVKPERVEWLWPARIPLGKLTILDGDPGLGKSTISVDLAARVSTSRPMPGETTARPSAGVILMSAEDGLADTIRPRLDAAGADVSRVVALVGIVAGDGTERLPTLPGDLAPLEAAIVENGAALVVVDVLMAYLSADVNAHRDQDVRGALAQLAAVAERTGAAIVVLRHLNKSAGGPAVYRGGGSIGIIGAARSALVVGRDPDDEERFVLAVTKANLAPLAPSLAYRIVDRNGSGAIEWAGVTTHTAAQLLAVQSAEADDDRGALGEAEEVLLTILAEGPVPVKLVQREAREAGIADRTLRRATEALGVIRRKVGKPGESGQRWEWSLPEGGQETPKVANPAGWSSSANLGHLRAEEVVDDDPPPEPPGDPTTAYVAPIRCDEYQAHQSFHRRVGGGWVCDACEATA